MWKNLLGGSQNMLLRSLRGAEWQWALDYLSPSFLEVMPMGQLISQGRELAGNSTNGERFEAARSQIERELGQREIAVSIVDAREGERLEAIDALDAAARRALGHTVLEIYFAQLFAGEWSILDLRGARFGVSDDGRAVWYPRPLYLRWDPAFLGGVRAMYEGFYRGDDARFHEGLAQLDLEAAGDVFVSHFGGGDQREVRFDSRVFHSTFHEAFVRCRDAGVTLHGNFVALGLYLACMYDVLETLDQSFDVRGAFERAVP